MPCRDDRDDSCYNVEINKNLEAALCAVLSAFATDADRENHLKKINWEAAGVKEVWVRVWWKQHQKLDSQRRMMEAAQQRTANLKKSAATKLTPEERRALGL